MANKPLQSIKFPDLPDTYTIPVVDSTLAVSGAAADAKQTGDSLADKVDKVSGKGLSTNDYTDEEKTKLAGVETRANKTVIDTTLTQSGQAADAKAVGDEISDLKADLDETINSETVYPNNLLNTQNVTTGYYWTDGHHDSTSYSNSGYVPVESGKTYYLWSDAHSGVFSIMKARFITGYDADKNFVNSSNVSDVQSYTVPSGVYYIIVSAVPAYLTTHGMITTQGTDAEYSEYFDPYITYEINMDYVDAYTKDETDSIVNTVDEKIDSTDETISGYKIPELLSELEVSPQLNLYNKNTATKNEFVGTNGTAILSDTYCHSAKIPVKKGIKYTFWALYNGAVVSANARFVCAYNSTNTAVSSSGSSSAISNYTVPDGISSIVVSFEQNRLDLFMVIEGETQPNRLLPYNLEHYIAKDDFISKAFSSLNRGDYFIKSNTATATANQTYELTQHLDAKKNCAYMFFGKFSAFTSVEIGHGKTETGANYMVIDGTNLVSYKPDGTAYQTTAHGLTITDFISVSIKNADTQTARATVTIITNGGSTTLTNVIFFGCNGGIYYKCGQETTDVEFVYTLMDLMKDVFIFGDSYTSLADDKRWPHYAISNGDNNMLLSGFAGADADEEYPSFETIVAMKTPKYLGWFLGMNNADASGQISSDWIIVVNQVLSYCDDHGIIPILATIPNTPTQRNVEKNAWVKSSGRRYVDFAKAVGGEDAGASWYTGMLSSDNVHPTAEGAKALWLQLRMDLPEIMERVVG